jgi:phosphocarrier protein HPr
MNGETLQRKVVVTNPQGLHLRPVTSFAKEAAKFQSQVTVAKGEQRINGRSPLELMMLGAEQGTELVLEVSGPDAAAALESLARILEAPAPDDGADTATDQSA